MRLEYIFPKTLKSKSRKMASGNPCRYNRISWTSLFFGCDTLVAYGLLERLEKEKIL